MQPLGKGNLGVSTFFAWSHFHDQCGADGLPLTPNSIKVLGRFQLLKILNHPRLCQYVDAVRGKHERLIIVTEHYANTLDDEMKNSNFEDHDAIMLLMYEILEGLAYINENGIVHRCLCPNNVLLDKEGHVKLARYGLYYMTGYGQDVTFPIGSPMYLAPEVLMAGPSRPKGKSNPTTSYPSGPKSDIWSVGIILLEVALGMHLWPGYTLSQRLGKILLLGKHAVTQHPLDSIIGEHSAQNKYNNLPTPMKVLLRQCLTVSVKERPCAKELLGSDVFCGFEPSCLLPKSKFTMFQYSGLRSVDLELPEYIETTLETKEDDFLAERSIREVYYLWGLAGGDLESELAKHGLLRSQPPLCSLPKVISESGDILGLEKVSSSLYDDTVVPLPLDQLRNRLENIQPQSFYPLIIESSSSKIGSTSISHELSETANLPLIIREKDVEYQLHRIVLFDRLLKGYPSTITKILQESRKDTPPLYRAEAWAALLAIDGDFRARYDAIDKETPIPLDSQFDKDIPRCHQYNEVLSSPDAHRKFKRILRAWVVSNPGLTYWQGIDSLCAPFLYLNFNNEALAYSCLQAFIPKYLYKFFLKDSAAIMHEYLAVFSHMIAFHDPDLSNHMASIGFFPQLFSIPWFLTMFSHVFPLHKIFHLWDTLLLGNESFPLCIGVAILRQLRETLLASGFDECISLFSDLPEIDIEKCVQQSISIFCSTPKSATYRQYGRPLKKTKDWSVSSLVKPVSYYSLDVNQTPRSELSREPLSLEVLKSECCPRISAEDLLELCDLNGTGSRSPTKKNKSSRPLILIVDIRNSDDFARGQIPGSINIPFDGAFSPEGDLVPCSAITQLNNHKGRVIVIVGHLGRDPANFAAQLIIKKFPKVCTLHGGIECLKLTGILTVSSPDL